MSSALNSAGELRAPAGAEWRYPNSRRRRIELECGVSGADWRSLAPDGAGNRGSVNLINVRSAVRIDLGPSGKASPCKHLACGGFVVSAIWTGIWTVFQSHICCVSRHATSTMIPSRCRYSCTRRRLRSFTAVARPDRRRLPCRSRLPGEEAKRRSDPVALDAALQVERDGRPCQLLAAHFMPRQSVLRGRSGTWEGAS